MRLILYALLAITAIGTAQAADPVPSRSTPASHIEPSSPEIKAKVRALLAEALKANDLWTALQLEAYATRIGLRTNPFLAGSEVIGDPLMAYPNQIGGFWDRGDALLVVSAGRCYQVAPDGRPLALSIPLGVMASACALSSDGKFIAGVEVKRHAATPVISYAANALPSGSLVFKTSTALTAGDYQQGRVCVAEDGSAILMGLFDANDAGPRLVLARPLDSNLVIPGYFRPAGVSAGGTWMLAQPWATRSEDIPPTALLMGGAAPRLLSTAVMGPGIGLGLVAKLPPPPPPPTAPAAPARSAPAPAAPAPAPAAPAATDTATTPAPPPQPVYTLHLITQSGTLVELPEAIGFSKSCRLLSVGRWAVVGSGYGAASPETIDLLGNVIEKGKERQPYTTEFYRWSDLLAEPPGPPALVVPGECTIAADEVNAVYAFHDKTISLIDLSGAQPVERPFAQTSFIIGSLRNEADMIKVRDDDGGNWLVLDSAAHAMWSGAAATCDLFATGYAVISSSGYQLIGLHEDMTKRTSTTLQVEGTGWEFTVDRYGRRVLAAKASKWIECDPATGKRKRSGTGHPPPAVARDQPDGRFRVECARVIEKSVPFGSEEPAASWAPQDSWRVGSTLLVLDRNSRIYVSGRRHTYTMLGTCDDAESFALFKDNLVLANDDDKVIAGFAAGPTLVTDFANKGMAAAEALPSLLWHIQGLSFQPPHGAVLLWDAAKAGFTPRLLRCPPGAQGLMAVTDSLIFDLDADIARQLGSPGKPAP
jgi:hypothetical protein